MERQNAPSHKSCNHDPSILQCHGIGCRLRGGRVLKLTFDNLEQQGGVDVSTCNVRISSGVPNSLQPQPSMLNIQHWGPSLTQTLAAPVFDSISLHVSRHSEIRADIVLSLKRSLLEVSVLVSSITTEAKSSPTPGCTRRCARHLPLMEVTYGRDERSQVFDPNTLYTDRDAGPSLDLRFASHELQGVRTIQLV